MSPLFNQNIKSKHYLNLTRKLCYRKDDRAMHAI